eukprot:TRINITY_DN9995_c0_g1_i2.p1 TRINITY_DN9995_c0_g1~~TRINITY_DN9995_c0_g1_i2.p1  ORF type:complete len:220 (-),score=40.52 TRINITY_DN9995_c0_g1_i2:19-678(-)
MQSIEESLSRLQTSYIDLYQVHRWDYGTPIEETLRTLDDLVRSGKVRYIGASSMYAWQFMKALHESSCQHLERYISMQCQYNLLYREEEREMLPLCRDQGVGVVPFCPLARGMLARPSSMHQTTIRASSDPVTPAYYAEEHDKKIVARVEEMAAQKGATMSQVALRWVLDQPGVVAAAVGVTRPEQLTDLVGAFQVHLSKEEQRTLEEPYRPRPLLNVL